VTQPAAAEQLEDTAEAGEGEASPAASATAPDCPAEVEQADTAGTQASSGPGDDTMPAATTDGGETTAAQPPTQSGEAAPDSAGNNSDPPPSDVDRMQRHDRALQAMRAGDYAEAFCIWRPMAEAGDPQAQFSLGWMYHNGYGLAIDDSKTLKWWQEAADQQLADAAFALGMLFNFGDGGGIERDVPRAANHYLQAARMGHEEAKSMLRALLEREPKALADLTAAWTDAEWQLISSPASIKVDRANVRSAPSLQAEILTRLVLGDQVLQLGREGRWVHIVIPDPLMSAWVHESLLE
jgi:TPR repeat protein